MLKVAKENDALTDRLFEALPSLAQDRCASIISVCALVKAARSHQTLRELLNCPLRVESICQILLTLSKWGFVKIENIFSAGSAEETFSIPKHMRHAAQIHAEARAKLPKRMHHEFAQLPATVESLLRRLSWIEKTPDCGKVLFLGDDDLFSVLWAILRPSDQVTVIDIDRGVLKTIANASKSNGLKINCVHGNLFYPLPPTARNSFDIFVTDPSHCVGGIALFVSRGISAIRKQSGGVGYFVEQSYGDDPLVTEDGLAKFHGLLSAKGVFFAFKVPGIIQYHWPLYFLRHLESILEMFQRSRLDDPLAPRLRRALRKTKVSELDPFARLGGEAFLRITVPPNCNPPIAGKFGSRERKRFGPAYFYQLNQNE